MFADLPPEDERDALLDALVELIQKRGPEPLVSWPVLLACPERFPDPWSPDLEGARLMVLRLMSYVGLGDLEVEIEAFAEEEEIDFSTSVGGVTTSRHREGASRFGAFSAARTGSWGTASRRRCGEPRCW